MSRRPCSFFPPPSHSHPVLHITPQPSTSSFPHGINPKNSAGKTRYLGFFQNFSDTKIPQCRSKYVSLHQRYNFPASSPPFTRSDTSAVQGRKRKKKKGKGVQTYECLAFYQTVGREEYDEDKDYKNKEKKRAGKCEMGKFCEGMLEEAINVLSKISDGIGNFFACMRDPENGAVSRTIIRKRRSCIKNF